MSNRNFGVRIGKTEYVNVSEWQSSGKRYFKAHMRIDGKPYTCSSNDMKQCALQLDKKLIDSGLEPINILKRK
jgi:hypothetical protein